MKAENLMPRVWIAGCLCTLAAAAVLAAGDGQARRQLDAHEHGVGKLDLVLDGDSLEIVLEGPMANFVGFEHAPRDRVEAVALEEALARLRDAGRLFRFPADAACRVADVAIDAPFHGGDHAHDGAHDVNRADGAHADITASYRFRCGRPLALSFVDVLLFAGFPETQKLVVRVIAPDHQGGATLVPGRTRVQIAER